MPKLERERSLAARVAGCADLQDIRLFGAAANLTTPVVEGSLSYTLSNEVNYQTVGDPIESLVVTGEYEVKVTETSPDEDSEATEVADISFALAALFMIPEPEEGQDAFTDDEYEAFAGTTGQFALYPYAREYISDITSRMGLPALHVGTLRFELDGRNED